MKKLNISLAAFFILFFVGTSYAQFMPQGVDNHLHVAQMGMGGLTTTVSSNAHTVIYNPGMLTRQKFALEITLPFGADIDLFDLTSFIQDFSDYGEEGINAFNSFDSLGPQGQAEFLQESQNFDNEWFGLNTSPFLGLSFKNFGLAVYQTVNANVKMDQGVLVPAFGMRAYGDLVLAAGFGKTFEIADREIGMGIAVRAIQRQELPTERISASDIKEIDVLAETMWEELPDPVSGFGLDFGAIHSFEIGEPGSENYLDVAIAVQDFYGSIDGEYVQPNLKLGTMYHLPFADNALLKKWDIGIEAVDVFNRDGVSFFQRVNMGTEMSVLAGLLSFRGGYHQGYPTYGLGLRFALVKLDFAMFSRELGKAPGQESDDRVYAQLSFGW